MYKSQFLLHTVTEKQTNVKSFLGGKIVLRRKIELYRTVLVEPLEPLLGQFLKYRVVPHLGVEHDAIKQRPAT